MNKVIWSQTNWRFEMRKLLVRFLILKVEEARTEAERQLIRQAHSLAFRTASGLGGIKDVTYHTPTPWNYETSWIRKFGWALLRGLDWLGRKQNVLYQLPLKSGEYAKGKRVVFSSGVQIHRTVGSEITTFARAYFDAYAR